jgi:hypothetical protein
MVCRNFIWPARSCFGYLTNLNIRVMQNKITRTLLLLLVLLSATSCEVIGDIFKAGMGFGIFIVVVVIAVIVLIVSKLGGSK